MNLAQPFKAGKGSSGEWCVAAATLDSTVAAATDFSWDPFVRAFQGPAEFIRPLRGVLFDSVAFDPALSTSESGMERLWRAAPHERKVHPYYVSTQ
jgi:hypothetical protein